MVVRAILLAANQRDPLLDLVMLPIVVIPFALYLACALKLRRRFKMQAESILSQRRPGDDEINFRWPIAKQSISHPGLRSKHIKYCLTCYLILLAGFAIVFLGGFIFEIVTERF